MTFPACSPSALFTMREQHARLRIKSWWADQDESLKMTPPVRRESAARYNAVAVGGVELRWGGSLRRPLLGTCVSLHFCLGLHRPENRGQPPDSSEVLHPPLRDSLRARASFVALADY